ncbi:MAG: alpha/beta hydrolase [Aquificaceae bacterium]|nr:MAG: alpha/beta hydrolase [Aquificaceae bacterium]
MKGVKLFAPKAVLFLHAFPLNKKMFVHQFKALEEANIPYIAIDYPGFGDAPLPISDDPPFEFYTDYIVQKLSELGIKKVIPIGVSMGGYIMFDLFKRYRELIDGLIFVATRAEEDPPERKKQRYELAQKVLNEGKDFLIDAMLDAQTSPATKKDGRKMEQLRCIMEEATPEGIASALRGMAKRPDYTHLLKELDVPTLVVAGADDTKVTPPEVVKRICDESNCSLYLEVPNSAHLPPFENPQFFNEKVIPWLRNVITDGNPECL